MDKVKGKKKPLEELCNLLAANRHDVMLLLAFVGSAGTLFKCLDWATKEMDIPNARQQASFTQHKQSTSPCVPITKPEETKANLRSKEKDKRQTTSLPTPPQSVHRGRPVNRPTPSRLTAFISIFMADNLKSIQGLQLRQRMVDVFCAAADALSNQLLGESVVHNEVQSLFQHELTQFKHGLPTYA
jgi:hypothetical protein